MYKALIDIGEFKKGEVVPEEKALLWKSMYLESPVEEVKDEIVSKPIPETVKKESEKVLPEGFQDEMLDDYLARSKNVVIKNVTKDRLPEGTIKKLIALEKKNKNRGRIITVLESKLEVD